MCCLCTAFVHPRQSNLFWAIERKETKWFSRFLSTIEGFLGVMAADLGSGKKNELKRGRFHASGHRRRCSSATDQRWSDRQRRRPEVQKYNLLTMISRLKTYETPTRLFPSRTGVVHTPDTYGTRRNTSKKKEVGHTPDTAPGGEQMKKKKEEEELWRQKESSVTRVNFLVY